MYVLSPGVRSTRSEDGAIVLDIEQGQIFKLNPLGSRILDLVGSGATESDVVDVISCEFNQCREVIERDVREFLLSLEKHRLIER